MDRKHKNATALTLTYCSSSAAVRQTRHFAMINLLINRPSLVVCGDGLEVDFWWWIYSLQLIREQEMNRVYCRSTSPDPRSDRNMRTANLGNRLCCLWEPTSAVLGEIRYGTRTVSYTLGNYRGSRKGAVTEEMMKNGVGGRKCPRERSEHE